MSYGLCSMSFALWAPGYEGLPTALTALSDLTAARLANQLPGDYPVTLFLLLRLIHIMVGVFWVGSVVFISAFLVPALLTVGSPGGAVMRQLAEGQRLNIYLIAASWITILSGLGLVWHDAGPLGVHWFEQGPGRFFGAGMILALIATGIGLAVNAPTASRMAALTAKIQAAGPPPAPEEVAQIQALQAKLGSAGRVVAVLLLLTVAFMAVAKYIP